MLGPLFIILSTIMSVSKHWQSITNAFEGGGVLDGIKRIGVVLLDSLLFPMQQFIELINQIPGIDISTGLIDDIRANLELDSPEQKAPVINNQQDRDEVRVSREEKINSQRLDLNINNNSSNDVDLESSGGIAGGIRLTAVL